MLRKELCVAFLMVACVFAGGCVEREMRITSEPEGAEVVVNQTWSGKTPFTMKFKHYGVYDIFLKMDGYYPMRVAEPVTAPLYQKAGVDFVSEALIPKRMKDVHELHYTLKKIDSEDSMEDVLSRSAKMKEHVIDITAERAAEDEKRPQKKLPLRTKEQTQDIKKQKKREREEHNLKEQEKQASDADTAPAEEKQDADKPEEADNSKAEPAE